MDNIVLTNPWNKNNFNKLRAKYESNFNKDELILIKSFLYKLKRCSINENIIIFWYLYWLYFLKIIDIDSIDINKEDRKKIEILEKTFIQENKWEFEKYLKWLFEIDWDLFIFNIRFKSTILSFNDKYMYLIPNKKNYIKSIWYIIPLLTMKWSKVLSIFQDMYFETLYKEKFENIKKFYQKQIKKIEFPWEHLNKLINDFSDIMYEENILWKTRIRRKSYFSLYNKIKRKKHQNIYDILWIMLVFKDIIDLQKFIKTFENTFIYIQKKDYIKTPKKNWYKSIHYKFMTMYRNIEIWVELQVKTQHIEKQLNSSNISSHFNYSMKEKKWDSIFKEVSCWYKILNEYLKK
jgi:ppGpp synthetase/RelA/SpoT-type nucleotidyltranferase